MKVYFVNQPNSLNNEEQVKKLEKNVIGIIKENEGLNAKKTYLYSADDGKSIATTQIISHALKKVNKKIKSNNIIFDSSLNGRNLGDVENLDEANIKKPLNIIKHPKQVLSFTLSELGFNNALKIETKKAFADRVFASIYQMVLNHEKNNDLIIISAPSDVYEIMQKDEGIHSMSYFGNEKAPNVSLQKSQIEEIGYSEKKLIKMGMPSIDKETNRLIPYWEKRAYEEYLSGMIRDIEKQL